MSEEIETIEKSEAVLSKAVRRTGQQLGLSSVELSDMLSLSTKDAEKMLDGSSFLTESDPGWDMALCLIFLLRNLQVNTSHDKEALLDWMSSNNLDLHGIPLEIIKTPAGLLRLIEYNEGYANKFGVYFDDAAVAREMLSPKS